MAVGVLVMLPGVTQESYEAVNRHIFGHYPVAPSDGPDGLILHSAGPTPAGFYVYDIWESKEQFQSFAEAKIGPAMQEVMGAGGPGPAPEFFEIANFVIAQ